jgi:hypothetical protein
MNNFDMFGMYGFASGLCLGITQSSHWYDTVEHEPTYHWYDTVEHEPTCKLEDTSCKTNHKVTYLLRKFQYGLDNPAK